MAGEIGIAPPGSPDVTDVPFDDVDELDLAELDTAGGPIDEATMRGFLAAMGETLHLIWRDPEIPELWRFTPSELDSITPGLTRVVNNRPKLAAAVQRGDTVFVAIHFAGYLGRNTSDLRRVQKQRQQEAENELDREAQSRGWPGAPVGGGADGGGTARGGVGFPGATPQ